MDNMLYTTTSGCQELPTLVITQNTHTVNCVKWKFMVSHNHIHLKKKYTPFGSDYIQLETFPFKTGCNETGYYGEMCDQQCPDGCQEQRCDVITGYCLGCLPGYQGLRCSKGVCINNCVAIY
jgi:hypothetical protein